MNNLKARAAVIVPNRGYAYRQIAGNKFIISPYSVGIDNITIKTLELIAQ